MGIYLSQHPDRSTGLPTEKSVCLDKQNSDVGLPDPENLLTTLLTYHGGGFSI